MSSSAADEPLRVLSDDWSGATWDGARMATLLEGARMTLPEKLAWLEETARAIDHLHRRAVERLRNRTSANR